MAWGARGSEPKKTAVIEFEVGQRTYRTEVDEFEATHGGLAHNAGNGIVTSKVDIITGQPIVINWARIAVIRRVG